MHPTNYRPTPAASERRLESHATVAGRVGAAIRRSSACSLSRGATNPAIAATGRSTSYDSFAFAGFGASGCHSRESPRASARVCGGAATTGNAAPAIDGETMEKLLGDRVSPVKPRCLRRVRELLEQRTDDPHDIDAHSGHHARLDTRAPAHTARLAPVGLRGTCSRRDAGRVRRSPGTDAPPRPRASRSDCSQPVRGGRAMASTTCVSRSQRDLPGTRLRQATRQRP
jgi:hypothetical protein